MERDRRNRELAEEERVIDKAQDERPYKCNIVFALICVVYGALLIYGITANKSSNGSISESGGGGSGKGL